MSTQLELGEEAFMVENHASNPDARKKDGSWKYRTFLPNAYNSAKAVVVGCLTYGVDMTDKGKSELQKLLKETKSISAPAKTDMERCESALRTLEKYYPSLTWDEQRIIQEQLRSIA